MRVMVHRIYTGTLAALEVRLFDEISRLQREGPLVPVCILVGSNALSSYLNYRLAEQRGPAANIRFYNFLDLATRLGRARAAVSRKPRLPFLGAALILDAILEQHAPAPFAAVSKYPGFRNSVLDTFRDLRDAGVTPPDFFLKLRQWPSLPGERKQQLEALAELFQRFYERLSLFCDVDDDFSWAIAESVRANEVLQTQSLLIYGIYDVTGRQSDLLGSLRDVLELVYFIPYLNQAASAFARPFVESRSKELGVNPEPVFHKNASRGLGVLADRIWMSSASVGRSSEDLSGRTPSAEIRTPGPASDGSFAFVSVPGESRAAVEVLREILRAVREGEIAGFHESAILLRHLNEDAPILTEAFQLRGIPYYIHGGRAFGERVLGRAVLAIASLASESFSRQSILQTVELVSACLPEYAADNWNAAAWRVLTNHPGFLAGIQSWDEGTKELVLDARRALLRVEALVTDQPEERASEFRLLVSQARTRLHDAQALRSGWTALRQAAVQWPDLLSWQDWADFLERRLQPLLGLSRDWLVFSNALDNLASLGEVAETARVEQKVGRARLVSVLKDTLNSLSIPQGSFQRSGVNILSLAASRGLRFPLVIISGLEEGRFPSKLRQDPLLFDEERSRLTPRLPIKWERSEEEKLLFDMAVRSAEKRLVLMCSRLEENTDRERLPSTFFLRAVAAARGRPVSYRDLTQENIPGFRSVRLDRPAPGGDDIAIDEAEVRLRLLLDQPRPQRVLYRLLRADPLRMAGPIAYSRARWEKRLTRFDGRIRHPELLRWIAGRVGTSAGQVSASRLEEYAKCPYLFFLRRVIQLEPWEEVKTGESIDPLVRGEVIHEILEGFARESLVKHSMEELQIRLASEARSRLESARPPGIPELLWQVELDFLCEMLQNWLAFEINRSHEGLAPAYVELTFGQLPKAQLPAYRVVAGRHTFDFRGRIDRIDLSADGTRARVLDYKVGVLPKTMEGKERISLMAGEKMQLAVYRAALSGLPELSGVSSVQGEFLHLQPRDGRTVSCSFDPQELVKGVDHLPGILETIGDGIENGIFFPRTRGSVHPQGHCEYCDYLTVCSKERIQREERKASDPAVLRHSRIGETAGAMEPDE
jgi:ATP-dependent helicase/nuclease subunit B